MKSCLFKKLALASLIGISGTSWAQPLPGAGTAVQSAIDRQAAQASEQAMGRAAQQAAERAAQQAAQNAQEQALGRVQEQTAERVQEQAAGRVVNQAAGRVQSQAENVQNQALDRVQNQAERAQEQALERAQSQLERVQSQAERLQEQASDRAQGQVERAQNVPGREQALPDVATQAQQQALGRADAGLGALPGLRPMAQLPDRLPVTDREGNQAFVEIAIEPNIRVLEREWVMLLDDAQRSQLISEAPQLMQYLAQTRPFAALDSFLLKFRVPPDLDANDQILQLVPEALRDLMDRNHVYSAQGSQQSDIENNPEAGQTGDLLQLPMSAVCSDPLSVGMIDSAIDTGHSAFGRNVRVINRKIIEEDVELPIGHGTAVAGVLIGEGPELQPLLPRGTVYNASVVYAQDSYNQGASVMHLLEALDWMIALEDVRVINMSLTGPANRLLEQGVRAAMANGKVIVAAAGNAGPHAPAFYPAAYEGVITATAVDRLGAVYRWANQGSHVDFSALGVSIPTARGDGGFGRESGTSMAAPVVSAFLACELASNGADLNAALVALTARAKDLGSPGHDPVFGHGLLHP